jgi:hypothetical protein
MNDLNERKQTVDIGTVGLLSEVGLEPGYYKKMREIERSRHTVVDSRYSCNKCHKKFYENKYGLYYICEDCFEKGHNEREIAIFNELRPLADGITQIDDNIFVLSINESEDLDQWRQKVRVLYEFEGLDGTENPFTEWVIKTTT